MLRFLRKSSAVIEDEVPARLPSVGEGRRVYAIGDVHGRRDLLEDLMKAIVEDCAARGNVERAELVLLGDLVDRGPDSAGVIDFAMAIGAAWPHMVCLRGNHEEVFQMALAGDLAALRFFLRMGGVETLLSYGVDQMRLAGDVDPDLVNHMLACVPVAHRDFLLDMKDSHVVGDYLFVHAGVRPGIALDEQRGTDMHWIRDEFLCSRADHGHMVVHGHTITEFVDEQPNRIGIDTGAFASDKLTAIGLEGTERWFLST